MGLKEKVKTIAIGAADVSVKTFAQSLVLQNTAQTSSQPFATTVVRIKSPTSFVVLDGSGNEVTVTYIGDRCIGAGGVVILDSGFAR